MSWIPAVLVGVIYFLFEFFINRRWIRVVIVTVIGFAVAGIIIGIDYAIQTTDTEVWSGHIDNWDHKEEWNEWHPPVTHCSTDSKGHKNCHTTPGYWEHHPAENYVETTDNGWMDVSRTPKGQEMDDSYPNTTNELKSIFPYGTPTSSTHTYTNKVQASYSIYKHPKIDLKKYPDLPKYPDEVHDYFYIDRILGYVPNKSKALMELAIKNMQLNKSVPDPQHKGKTKSWKEVNLIFINVGDKPQDYGYALQDYWENGNKNDFIVAFSMKKDGTLNWVYPFSWSEVAALKIDVREYMMDQKKFTDFVPVVQKVSDLVAKEFKRKQFADFNYLQIETSNTAIIIIWIMNILIGIGAAVLSYAETRERNNFY